MSYNVLYINSLIDTAVSQIKPSMPERVSCAEKLKQTISETAESSSGNLELLYEALLATPELAENCAVKVHYFKDCAGRASAKFDKKIIEVQAGKRLAPKVAIHVNASGMYIFEFLAEPNIVQSVISIHMSKSMLQATSL